MSPFTLDYLARLETWALMASLLQGGLVCLSWAAWSRSARAAEASLRHRLACLHFAALLALPLLTLLVLQWSVDGMVYAVRCNCAPAAADRRLEALAAPAALVWALGVVAMAAQLAVGGWGLGRLKRAPAPVETIEAVRRLAARWRGCPALEVHEANVDAPQVVGLLRPTLLLPREFETRLAPAEREAVLLHELAHAARGDFGWNLVQRMVLAALWFHPAAWFVYGRLRREREIRCDALAVRQGASAGALARALVRLAEDQGRPRLAMPLSGGGDLSVRVRRLLQAGGRGPSAPFARSAALLISMLCVLTLGAGRLAQADPSIRDAYVASAFGPTLSLEARDPAGSFAVKVRQGRVVAASVGRAPAQIVQRGGQVVLIGKAHQPIVALTVSPEGEIRWRPRV